MSDLDHTTPIKAMYDERSSHYDDSPYHVRQAHEYIHHAQLKPGDNVLDLACGTGLVTLLAKRAVGPHGHVVGVDISAGMLAVARAKSARDGLAITFFEHDISDLSGLMKELVPPQGSQEGGGESRERGIFDVITCASALVLIQDPLQAITHWASDELLRPGGRLITDIPAERTSTATHIFAEIGPLVGESLWWDSSSLQSQESLEQLFTQAGLNVERVFRTEAYVTDDYDVSAAGEVFDKAVAGPMFRNFGQPAAVKEKAKRLFVERFAAMAGSDGLVHDEVGCYMGIARKGM